MRSTTRNGPLRVIRVGTGVPGQRTPEGLGVGSRARDIASRFPDVLCEHRYREQGWGYGTWMVLVHPGGTMTAFQLHFEQTPARELFAKVIQVLVQRSWLNDTDSSPALKCPDEYLRA